MRFRSFLEGQFFRPDGTIQSAPGYLYHATNEDNLFDIKSSGNLDVFGPSHGTDQDMWPDGDTSDRSYWTDRASSAWFFSPEDGNPVILRTPKSSSFKREGGTGDYYSEAPIPSSRIEVLMADGSWRPLN